MENIKEQATVQKREPKIIGLILDHYGCDFEMGS